MDNNELEWGETPWDNMNRDELLREVQRMYAAVNAGYSALNITRHENASGFWGEDGSGGRALEMMRQIDEPLRERYEDGIYRSFLRYAIDLLFDQSTGYRIGAGWAVCPTCDTMLGRRADGTSMIGQRCGDVFFDKDCDGIMRPIEWEDLRPNN